MGTGSAEKRVRGICMAIQYDNGRPTDAHVYDIGTPAVFPEKAFFECGPKHGGSQLRRFGFVEWWSDDPPRVTGLVRRDGDVLFADWKVAAFVEEAIKEKIERDLAIA